jgi:hypothetical protein
MSSEWPPARKGQSIYRYVSEHLGPDGALNPENASLPDEGRVMTGEVKWAPGAMEGVFGHHVGAGDDRQDRTGVVVKRLNAAVGRPSNWNLRRLYDAVCDDNVLSIVDRVVERVASPGTNRGGVHQLGRWLATTGVDRGAVKMGIALLAATGLDQDVDVVRLLGRHEEFTLYAAVAMSNKAHDREAELWNLAQAVHGWGRIHCVERRAATQDPRFRAWQQADQSRAELLVSLARQLLPLDEIPTGPSDSLGIGPDWRPHVALDWTLQALRDHVGVGPDLVLIALQSPVIRNRNMALNVLKAWPRETWSEGAYELAKRLAVADPREKTRASAAAYELCLAWSGTCPHETGLQAGSPPIAVLTCGGAQVILPPGRFGAHHGDWF